MDMYSPTSRLLWFTFVVNVQMQKDYLDMGCNCYFRSELAFSFIDVSIFACFFLKGMLQKWMGCHIGGLQYQSYYASNTSLFQPARLGLETFKKRSFLQVIEKTWTTNNNNVYCRNIFEVANIANTDCCHGGLQVIWYIKIGGINGWSRLYPPIFECLTINQMMPFNRGIEHLDWQDYH